MQAISCARSEAAELRREVSRLRGEEVALREMGSEELAALASQLEAALGRVRAAHALVSLVILH